ARPSTMTIDETYVLKNGWTVMVNWKDGHMTMWDYVSGVSVDYFKNSTDKVGGHWDLGNTVDANSDGWDTGIQVRGWAALHSPRNIVQYLRPDGTLNWSLGDHSSMRTDAEKWVSVSTHEGDGTWAAFEDEVYIARTDGSGFVRLAHTRSYQLNPDPSIKYYAQPRAVIDRYGQYIVYTSDLGSATRLDVMILKVPKAYW